MPEGPEVRIISEQIGGLGSVYSEKEEQEAKNSIAEVVKDIKTALYFWEHK